MDYVNFSIEGLTSSVPKNTVGNEYYDSMFSDRELKIFERTTGIKERRHVIGGMTASDLALDAAERLLTKMKIDKSSIKGLVWVSQTSDYQIPFTSNILADKLELSSEVFCLDINAGCAGFIQGLFVSSKLISNSSEKVLFLVGETLSKILASSDRSTSPLFGDGASAIILGYNSLELKSYFKFGQDGSLFRSIIIPEGGYRHPISNESCIQCGESKSSNSSTKLQMDGQAVFDFTLREIPRFIIEFYKDLDVDITSVDYFVLHQSNRLIISQILSQVGVPMSKALVNIEKFGNTSGVSIPLALTTCLGHIGIDREVCFVGYGSGLTWGICHTRLSKDLIILPFNEV
jgi:3-oxoacyl-[acyl-carrier-protein] synthase-3